MDDTAPEDAARKRAARKIEKHAEKSNRILEVAGDLFFRKGFANTSMDEIAAELGVKKPFVYYYFRDKLNIFDTLCVQSSNLTHTAFQGTAVAGASPTERLSRGLCELILRYLQTFAGGALFYKEPGLLKGEAQEIVRRNALILHGDLLQVLEDGRATGEFAFDDTKLTALMIGGAIGFMFTWYRPDSKLSPEALANHMAASLMKLVAVPDGGAPG